MKLLDLSFPDPQKNLDLDGELLCKADKGEGGEVLRFWESPQYFIVLGRTGISADDVDEVAAARDHIPVLRRTSAGGTVLQGPGCLNFSLILSKKRHLDLQMISKSYVFILGKILVALKGLGVEGEFRPVCDLVVGPGEKKFSGNAQRRGREFILHHGTILYDFDLTLISRYLKQPKKMPVYREGRPHTDFVTNIPVSSQDIRRVIAQAFLNQD